MFYVIGLGLGDAKDITIKGLEIVQKCDRVYLESYTSMLTVGVDELETFYGRKVIIADRELVEQGAHEILKDSETSNIAFLVVGDPFGATTHTDLILRAKEQSIPYKVVHNASIMNAIGCCGLQLYSFGETISIPFWSETWQPDSFYDKIIANLKRGLHTLCLLDIKVKEPTLESLTKKVKQYQPPRFMSVSEASSQLVRIIKRKLQTGEEQMLNPESVCVGIARVGSDNQKIVATTLNLMQSMDLGPPLHSLVIPASYLHPLEGEFLSQFCSNPEIFLNK